MSRSQRDDALVRRLIPISVVCLCASALVLGVSTASAAFPGKPGPIVYSKVDDSEIEEGRLRSVGGLYIHGPRVRQQARPLTTDTGDHSPAFSSDGRQVVFVSDGEAARTTSIQVIGTDGSGRREVIARGGGPTFFPSGRAIAFVRLAGGHNHIFTVRLDGSGLRQLTRGPHDNHGPVVSPNGRRIVFASDRDPDGRRDRSDIFTMRSNGSGVRVLIDGPRSESEPDYAPDGRRIVFAGNRSDRSDIYVAQVKGGRAKRLTRCRETPIRCPRYQHPVFSPDGRHVAFLNSGRRSSSIEVIRSDGKRSIGSFDTAGTEEEGFGSRLGVPAWGPRPR